MLLTSVQNKQTTFGSKNYLQSELILVNIEGFYISFLFHNIYYLCFYYEIFILFTMSSLRRGVRK